MKGVAMEEKIKQVTVHMPRSIYTKVKNLADKERRSFSNQVVYMLEKMLEGGNND